MMENMDVRDLTSSASTSNMKLRMKSKSLAANVGLYAFGIGFLFVLIAFFTTSWIVSDQRLTGEKLERFGLWVHCFRSLPDPNDVHVRRFFVGCRWIFDPFTRGYNEIRGFLVPGYIVATQFFYTVNFLSVIIGVVLITIYFSCIDPEHQQFIKLIQLVALDLLIGGLSGCLGVLVFGFTANRDNWMPGHANNFFGWSFVIATIGSLATVVAAILFFVDAHVQKKAQRFFRQSQTRFQLDSDCN